MSVILSEILQRINRERPLSAAQLRRYLKALNLRPLGARQRPQRYAPDTAERVLEHLGFVEKKGKSRIPSMAELRKERRKAA